MTHYTHPDIRALAERINALEKRLDGFLSPAVAYEVIVDPGNLQPGGIVRIADPESEAITQEIAQELAPQQYEAIHKGKGRYLVRNHKTDVEIMADDGSWFPKKEAQRRAEELNAGLAA